MSSWRIKIAIKIFKLLSCYQATNFSKALHAPQQAQQRVLQEIINHLSESRYGTALNINKRSNYIDFKNGVPIVNYDDLTPWIEQAKQGEKKVLTPYPINFFEKTSGSSGAAKYIPYNKKLLNSFNQMFLIWVYDLVSHGPSIETGRIFMSISPAIKHEKLADSYIPVGLNDDSHYLQKMWRRLIKPFLLTPPRDVTNLVEFRYLLAATLLADEKLEIISIWNPTYLLAIIETITLYRDDLIRDLSNGYIKENNYRYNFPVLSAERKKLLSVPDIAWQKIWPHLKIISCWTSGAAKPAANKLKDLFPHVFIQGKGLLATEAPITIPLIDTPGYVPLLNEVFFEFTDDTGSIFLLHELVVGKKYELIVSQKGGLYRYRIGDLVEVVGLNSNTPCLEFLGRTNNTCDLVGEKLTEAFVLEALNAILPSGTVFFMLVPFVDADGFGRYILLSEPNLFVNDKKLDDELSKSYHYRHARFVGQLKKAEIILASDMAARVQDFWLSQGMKWGNIKDKVFLTNIVLAKQLLDFVSGIGNSASY